MKEIQFGRNDYIRKHIWSIKGGVTHRTRREEVLRIRRRPPSRGDIVMQGLRRSLLTIEGKRVF